MSAKSSPTFDPLGSFGSALFGALSLSIGNFFELAFEEIFAPTLLRCVVLAGGLLPHRPGAAPPRSVTAVLAPHREALCFPPRRSSSLPAVGGGGLSLARRLQSLLDISAASIVFGAESSIASPLGRAWKQPSTCLLPVAPHARRTMRQPLRRSLTRICPTLKGAAHLPAVPAKVSRAHWDEVRLLSAGCLVCRAVPLQAYEHHVHARDLQ